MADTWWVIIRQSDAGKDASYLDKVDFRVNYGPGTSQYTALTDRKPFSWDGMTMIYWQGPFATEADAKAAQNPQPSPGGVSALANAIPGVSGVTDFLSRLSNPHTWLRVAEAVVGIAFLMIGLNALLHNPAGKVAKVAAKVAP